MMHVTMVKKINHVGHACPQCLLAERVLKQRGHWGLIDHVALADEANLESEGFALAATYRVTSAPFFIVADAQGGTQIFRHYQELLNHCCRRPSEPLVMTPVEQSIPEYI